jgi:predicted transcriptional regulator
MITAEQMRAARALLKWSAQDLARRTGISWRTIQRLEVGSGVPASRSKNLERIRQTFESAGVVFIDRDGIAGPGVRLREIHGSDAPTQ